VFDHSSAEPSAIFCCSRRREPLLPSTAVRDLRVLIDSDVAVRSHVSRRVSGCFAVLRPLRSIRHLVSDSVFHSLVVSLVVPRLDCCNAALTGLPASQLSRLWSVLGAAARLMHRSSRYERVTPVLRDLHWPRSPERIDFKLAVLTYRCLRGLAPRYLSDYIQSVTVSNRRRLQSSSSSQLVIRRTRLSTVGDHAFPVAGCRLWNSLPPDVTSASTLSVFRNRLKAYLFSRYHFLPNCFRFLVLHTE